MIFSRQGLITQLMSKAKYRKFRIYSYTLRRYLTIAELNKVSITPSVDYTIGYYLNNPVIFMDIPQSTTVKVTYDLGYGGIVESGTIVYLENYSNEIYELTLSIAFIEDPDITLALVSKTVNSQTRPISYVYRGSCSIPSEYAPSVASLVVNLDVSNSRGEALITSVASFRVDKDTYTNPSSLTINTTSMGTPAFASVRSIECDASEPNKAVYEAWVGKKVTLVNNISRD